MLLWNRWLVVHIKYQVGGGFDNLSLNSLTANSIILGNNQIILDKDGNIRVEGTLIVDGSIYIDGDLTLDGKLVAKEVETGKLSLGDETAGTAVLKAGETKVNIKASEIGDKSLVFITPTTRTYNVLTVTKQVKGEGFTVLRLLSNGRRH